jgi:hypothetical protein
MMLSSSVMSSGRKLTRLNSSSSWDTAAFNRRNLGPMPACSLQARAAAAGGAAC